MSNGTKKPTATLKIVNGKNSVVARVGSVGKKEVNGRKLVIVTLPSRKKHEIGANVSASKANKLTKGDKVTVEFSTGVTLTPKEPS